MLGADSIQTQDFSFTVDVEIGNSTAVSYTHLDVYKRQLLLQTSVDSQRDLITMHMGIFRLLQIRPD